MTMWVTCNNMLLNKLSSFTNFMDNDTEIKLEPLYLDFVSDDVNELEDLLMERGNSTTK